MLTLTRPNDNASERTKASQAVSHIVVGIWLAWWAAEIVAQQGPIVSVTWSNTPIRTGLQRLTDVHAVPVFLDRRIDPETPMTLQIVNQTLQRLLTKVASSADGEVALLGRSIYLRPKDQATSLATTYQLRLRQIKTFSAEDIGRWLELKPMTWERLSRPRDIVARWSQDAGLQATGLEQIPHDVWAEYHAGDVTFCERLTIVLAGFDLSFEPRPDGFRIVPMEQDAVIEQSYAASIRQHPKWLEVKQQLAKANVKVGSRELLVTADWETHLQVRSLLEDKDAPIRQGDDDIDFSRKRFTLTVKDQPFEPVLQALAKQLSVELTIDAGISQEIRQRRITLSVQNATLQELLDAAIQDVPVAYRWHEKRLTIESK
ncbi:MAG: hypothetical protein R3C28_06955 [Pirellulaceae bacterium]